MAKPLRGFGNELDSEAPGYEGILPEDNNPQKLERNLKTEQLSGSAFTSMPRANNKRSWLYRLSPSVGHTKFRLIPRHEHNLDFESGTVDPNQRRWTPMKRLEGCDLDFVKGLRTLAYSNSQGQESIAIHLYQANRDMGNTCFFNSDGHFLIVPQQGTLEVITEFGCLTVEPCEIVVIPQGIKFSVNRKSCDSVDYISGYVLELKGNHFELPNLGAMGANGLANPRDFIAPSASLGDTSQQDFRLINKFGNELFEARQNWSPYNVAGWKGNYYPYKYNLNRFTTINSVSVDHPDPSIFTVLTCPSAGRPGTALADFVIFPPRWECAIDTFRPPYFHRNCMTEFMGLIKGQYQAKGAKFAPGGASLHQAMAAHGPDYESYVKAINEDTKKPNRVADGTMAFMFETSLMLKVTKWAQTNNVDEDYLECWKGINEMNIS